MLPAAITSIQQAFKEIKHMTIDTWQEECRLAARRAMKEVIEHRMHNGIDAFLVTLRNANQCVCINPSLPSRIRIDPASGTQTPEEAFLSSGVAAIHEQRRTMNHP